MRRAVTIALLVLVALLVVGQFAIPPLAAGQLASRLTRDGGTATVTVSAFPAVRLLWESGDELEIHASDVEAELNTEAHVFHQLDRFKDVTIDMTDITAGGVTVSTFQLGRHGDAPYDLVLNGSATPQELSDLAAGQISGPLGELSGIVTGFLPDVKVPVEVNATIESDEGNLRLVSGAGTVAGIPAGPIVASITAAIISRIGL